MRIIRSYIEATLKTGQELVLPEPVSNHIVRVLRLETGDIFHLFNGDGHDYPCRIQSLEKRGARILVLGQIAVANESPLRIHLFQSIARGEKMDWILQKATELGVAEFTPMVSDRTEVKLDGERSDKKLAHWQGVVRSACEQSGRARIPVVNPPIAIHRIDAAGIAGAFYLQPDAEHGIAGLTIPADGKIVLAIGPEGGFTERDTRLLQTAGFGGLRVGPRILRTETAGIAVTAALQSHYGDW